MKRDAALARAQGRLLVLRRRIAAAILCWATALGGIACQAQSHPDNPTAPRGAAARAAAALDAAPPQPGSGSDRLLVVVAVAAGVLAVGLIGVAAYFLVVVPRRRRRPLLAALEILQNEEKELFPQAEQLLRDALTAGLSKRDLADTRFALAYVRARMRRYAEAAAVLADMPEADRDRETAYLELWIQSRLAAHRKVEELYLKYGERLSNLLDTKLIAGIAYLKMARDDLAAKRISLAADSFRKVRALGVLPDEIPQHIDDHHVLLGISALFEKNGEEAKNQFEGAVKSAEENRKPTETGELGLLLCRWCKEKSAAIDDDLGKVIHRLRQALPSDGRRAVVECAHCNHQFRVSAAVQGKRVLCRDCHSHFLVQFAPEDLKPATEVKLPDKGPSPDQADEGTPPDEAVEKEVLLLLGDDEQLLRNALLWHAISLVMSWHVLPENGGLAARELQRLDERLDRAIAVDPDFGDAYLVKHLIAYYFAETDADRDKAVEGLKQSARKGVNVPEVLNLIEREERLAQYYADSLNRFFALIRNYLNNKTVPDSYRQKLRDRLSRYARFRDIGDVDLQKGEDDAAPTVGDLQTRSDLLRRRVAAVVQSQLTDKEKEEREAIQSLVKHLDNRTKRMVKIVARVQDVEHDLMAKTGEFVLQEEEEGGASAPKA